MLSKAQVVKARKALEGLYIGKTTVVVKEEYERPNGSIGFYDKTILENEPCRVSYKDISQANSDSTVATTQQVIKLFLAPEYDIPRGSKIVVEQNGRTNEYVRSGKPAIYETHQEIILEEFEGGNNEC